ncbi:hypothetical protein J3R83DRAFT_2416 [Lanmaoa asiatica]|nr:hypothetical protein J3R83DRAFT_2416 [Lanmaoa asiatica]
MGATYRQIQPAPANVTGSSSSINSDLALQPMVPRLFPQGMPRQNPRGDRSVICSPHHPIRTLSSPVQAVSPKETSLHICQWTGNDDNICGAQITYASVPGHLTVHGVEHMAHNHRLPCRWSGCRLRRDKDMMKRESIVRHVREKHMGYRRTL